MSSLSSDSSDSSRLTPNVTVMYRKNCWYIIYLIIPKFVCLLCEIPIHQDIILIPVRTIYQTEYWLYFPFIDIIYKYRKYKYSGIAFKHIKFQFVWWQFNLIWTELLYINIITQIYCKQFIWLSKRKWSFSYIIGFSALPKYPSMNIYKTFLDDLIACQNRIYFRYLISTYTAFEIIN